MTLCRYSQRYSIPDKMNCGRQLFLWPRPINWRFMWQKSYILLGQECWYVLMCDGEFWAWWICKKDNFLNSLSRNFLFSASDTKCFLLKVIFPLATYHLIWMGFYAHLYFSHCLPQLSSSLVSWLHLTNKHVMI